eukprot:gene21552-25920_t
MGLVASSQTPIPECSKRSDCVLALRLPAVAQYRAYYRLWEPLLRHVPATRVAILSPDFVTAASEMWWILLDELQQEGASAGIVRRKDGTCARHKVRIEEASIAMGEMGGMGLMVGWE